MNTKPDIKTMLVNYLIDTYWYELDTKTLLKIIRIVKQADKTQNTQRMEELVQLSQDMGMYDE